MNADQLCMALMRADTDDEVVGLLTDAGYWNDTNAWRYVGDNENNFASIGNQQSEPVAALIEKIVNSVDARLTNACLEAGIEPTSATAPRSIREAVTRFFDDRPVSDPDKAGRIALWRDAKTTAEGRLLTVAATGYAAKDGRPSITVADQGEGHEPDAQPDTFMSLGRSNKLRVPFVQGKFNMGGTGALQFCSGRHRLQLVVSRRNPTLLGKDASERDHEWGFTVVRREAPPQGSKSSVFTYLAPIGAGPDRKGAVLSFKADEWPIFPEADSKARDAYFRAARYGSLVKLYEYEWQGTKSNIVSSGGGLLRRIDLGLTEVALPVRIFECRPEYKGHTGSFATNVLGLGARLERDKADNLEPDFPVSNIIDLDGKTVRARVFAFKKGRAAEYRTARHGVVFSVNGQAHATLPSNFFRDKSVGMSYLADSLLVMVDCTNIEGEMREDLFMNSRDRLRSNALSDRLEHEVQVFLKDEPTLKALRNRRRQEELANQLSDSKPLRDALEDFLRRSPMLAKLFLEGVKLPSPFPSLAGGGAGGGGEFKGKTYPTFFRFRGLRDGEPLERDAHLGSRVHVSFETDAANDYFDRDLDRGTTSLFRVSEGGRVEWNNWSMHGPLSGVATLNLDLPETMQEGSVVTFESEVTDPSRIEHFVNRFTLRVRKPGVRNSGTTGRRRTSTSGTGNQGGPAGLALPNIVEVEENDWPAHGFDATTAAVIKHAGEADGGSEVFDFFINIDNKYLRIVEKESKEEPKLLKARFVYAFVLVGLALIQDDRSRPAPDASEESEDVSERPGIEQVVARTTSALAPVLLPLIETIGSLSLDESDD